MSLASIIKLIRMGVLSGIGALININTFGGGRLFERGHLLDGGCYIKSLRYSRLPVAILLQIQVCT